MPISNNLLGNIITNVSPTIRGIKKASIANITNHYQSKKYNPIENSLQRAGVQHYHGMYVFILFVPDLLPKTRSL